MSQESKPERFTWIDKRDQLAEDAKTMTCAEMAEKYGTYRSNMQTALYRLGIKIANKIVDWSLHVEEMKRLAPTHTVKDMAKHFNADPGNMYVVLRRHGIEPKHAERPPKFSGGLAELARLSETMTEKELAEHFAIAQLTVRKHLKRLGIQCKPPDNTWESRREEVTRKVAEGWTCERLAEHYGCSVSALRNALSRIGVGIKEVKRAARPAAEAAKPAAPKPPQIQQTKPAPSSAPRGPVQIVMPANVKFTRAPFNPPPDSRICNGSSTAPYVPTMHGGATTSYR